MKHKFLFYPLMAIALVGCNEADEPSPNLISDEALTFETYIGRSAQSRGAVITNTNIQNFGVFATWCPGLDYASGDKSFNFMNNQKVTKSGSSWTYSPIKYWPSGRNEKVSFFAYAPYAEQIPQGDDEPDDEMSWIDSRATIVDGAPAVWYNLGKDVSGHIDVLTASVVDRIRTPYIVPLEFHHALSRISFKVQGWRSGFEDENTTITINSVKLVTSTMRKQLNLMTGEWINNTNLGAKPPDFITF